LVKQVTPAAVALTFALAASAQAFPLPPRFSVTVAPCPCAFPGQVAPPTGYAYPDGTVYIDPSVQTRTSLWHELGHVFDFERLTDGDRNWFVRAFHRGGGWDAWFQPDGMGFNEVFADEYSACA
jgi:hypothetical protein